MNTTEPSKKRQGVPVSLRVTPLCRRLWNELAEREGQTNTGYLEFLIRQRARQIGILSEVREEGNDTANHIHSL